MEHEPAIAGARYVPALLMNEDVMPPAQQHEGVEIGAASVGPVLEVVYLQEDRAPAAGELAVVVPVLHLAGSHPGIFRLLRPMPIGLPSLSMATSTAESHPSIRAVSLDMTGPTKSSETPDPAGSMRASRSTWTTVVGVFASPSAVAQTSNSESAIRFDQSSYESVSGFLGIALAPSTNRSSTT